MFKNPWTGLIVFTIAKISAIMLIRMWLTKQVNEHLKDHPQYKYMFPQK